MARSEINFFFSNFSRRFQIFFRNLKKRVMFLDMAITSLILCYSISLDNIQSSLWVEKIILSIFTSMTFLLKMLCFHAIAMERVWLLAILVPRQRKYQDFVAAALITKTVITLRIRSVVKYRYRHTVKNSVDISSN